MERKKIDRINELAKKAKTTGLTKAETEERQALRQEYVKAFRDNMKAMLDNIEIKKD